ncbi:hypothetical protein BKA81DRAFT_93181 [Phyllosticta paracitricarpa]
MYIILATTTTVTKTTNAPPQPTSAEISAPSPTRPPIRYDMIHLAQYTQAGTYPPTHAHHSSVLLPLCVHTRSLALPMTLAAQRRARWMRCPSPFAQPGTSASIDIAVLCNTAAAAGRMQMVCPSVCVCVCVSLSCERKKMPCASSHLSALAVSEVVF